MPRLHTFTYYFASEKEIDNDTDIGIFNSDIQRSFTNITYEQVTSLINYLEPCKMISDICSVPFKFHFLQHIGNNNPNIPRSTIPPAETDCFLCFSATDPMDPVGFWSAPLSSDGFITTRFRSSFCRKSSAKFRPGIRWKSTEPMGTRPTKSGPESCSKEIVEIQRNRSVPTYRA